MILLSAQLVRPGVYVGPAFSDDVESISGLLGHAGLHCLPVSQRELQGRLGEFEIVRSPSGQAVGCAAVHGTDDRTELRCLAVHPSWRGTGVGRLLVERAVERALAANEELFCVSRRPAFFESLGFTRLPEGAVPERSEASVSGPSRCALVRRKSPLTLSEAVA